MKVFHLRSRTPDFTVSVRIALEALAIAKRQEKNVKNWKGRNETVISPTPHDHDMTVGVENPEELATRPPGDLSKVTACKFHLEKSILYL